MGSPVLPETERRQQSSSRNGSRRGERSCRRRFLARPDSKMAHANPGERHGLWPFILLLSESVSRPVVSDSLQPHDCGLPGSSVHGILQAIILEWVAISSSRGIFLTQGSNPGLPHCRQILYYVSHHASPSHVQSSNV